MEKMLQKNEETIVKKRTEVEELEKEHQELRTRLVELQLEAEAKNCRDLKTALESIDDIRRDLTEIRHNNGTTEEQILGISSKLENVEKAAEETKNQAMAMSLEISESKKIQKTEMEQKLKIMEKSLEEQKEKLQKSMEKALEDQRIIHEKYRKKTEDSLEEQRKLNEKLSARLEWLEDKRTILMVRGTGETKELLIFDRETSQWKTSPVELPEAVYCCGMICLEQEIYIFGGGLLDKTFKLNKEMKWGRMADMNEGRDNMGSCFLLFDGWIWVFGGRNRSKEVLNTVEKYIPSENKWIKKPPMDQKRKSAAAAVCGGKIYVCGGNFGPDDSAVALKSVECFDPKEEVWTKFVDLPTPNWGMGVFSDGGCLIIYGGTEPKIGFRSVWKINANDASPKWKELPSMKETRYFLAVQSIGKRIFAIGGHGKKSVEIFDGTSWESGPELPEICWGVPSVVIPQSLAAKLLPK